MEPLDSNLVATHQLSASDELTQVDQTSITPNSFDESVAVPVSDIPLQTQRSAEFLVNSGPTIPLKLKTNSGEEILNTPISTSREDVQYSKTPTPVTAKKERVTPVSLKRERSENWQHQETKLLLSLWERYYDDLKKYKRNSNVWERIAKEFQANGFERKAAQCKSRVRVLMAKHKACFHNDVEVPEAVENFDYFEEVHRLITGNFSRVKNLSSYSAKLNSHGFQSVPQSNSRGYTCVNPTSSTNSDDDENMFEHSPNHAKLLEQICVVIQHLVHCEERDDRDREIEKQIRRKRHRERLDFRAERAKLLKERAQSREEEINQVIATQNEIMNSLIEAIKRP